MPQTSPCPHHHPTPPFPPTPQGQISIDLYVDQNNVALFLDCKGEIDILPVLDIPPIKGELGVLLSIGFGEVRRGIIREAREEGTTPHAPNLSNHCLE